MDIQPATGVKGADWARAPVLSRRLKLTLVPVKQNLAIARLLCTIYSPAATLTFHVMGAAVARVPKSTKG